MGISERSVYRYLGIINMIDAIEYERERRGYNFTNGDRIIELKERSLCFKPKKDFGFEEHHH